MWDGSILRETVCTQCGERTKDRSAPADPKIAKKVRPRHGFGHHLSGVKGGLPPEHLIVWRRRTSAAEPDVETAPEVAPEEVQVPGEALAEAEINTEQNREV